MTLADWFLLLLRIAHALAAAVWLGGGVYYLVAIRPIARGSGDVPREFISTAQRQFGEWAQTATIVMLATGAVLMFDRLATDGEGLTYASLLATKIVAAIAAFWLAGVRPGRRVARRRGGRGKSTPEWILSLGMLAFVLGVLLSSIYGRTQT